MVQLLGPVASSEARGKIGGIVHNTWRGINYAKAQTSPSQPRSKLQLQIRANQTMLVRKWQTLTPTNRSNWNDYATTHTELSRLGKTKRLSGLNWYTRCNIILVRYAQPLQGDPPTTPAPDAPASFAAADGILTSICTWTAYTGTDKWLEVWLVGPHSKGLLAKIERARYRINATGASGTLTIPTLQVGRYTMFARAIDSDNGLASPWVSDTADVTAA